MAAAASARCGRRRAPRSKASVPPWAWAIERQIERPKPRPFGLWLTKGLKASACISGERPRPRSATASLAEAVVADPRLDDDPPLRRRQLRHRLGGVQHQVQQRPAEAAAGCPGPSAPARPRRTSTRVWRAMSSLRASVTVAVTTWLRSTSLERGVALHHQPPQLRDDAGGAPVVVGDVRENIRELLQVRRLGPEQLRAGLGIGEDGGRAAG